MQVWRSWNPTISALCSIGIQYDTGTWVLYCTCDSPAWISHSRLKWMILGLDCTKSKIRLFLFNHLIHFTSGFCCFKTAVKCLFTQHFFLQKKKRLFTQNLFTKFWVHKFVLQNRKLIFKHLYSPYFQAAFVFPEAHCKLQLLLVLIMTIPTVTITVTVLIHMLCASISCGFSKTKFRCFQAASSTWGSVEQLIYISWGFSPKSLLKVTESFLLGCLFLGKITLFTGKLLFGVFPYVTALLAKWRDQKRWGR